MKKRVYLVILISFAFLCLMQIIHRPLGVSISEGKSFVFPEIIEWKQSGGSRQTPFKNPVASLKWVLQDPNVHIVVPGFTTFDQMEVDLAIMEDLNFTDSEKKDLQREASIPGSYCQGCRECLGQCSEGLPIPDLMRAYMYVYDYRNLSMAQDLVASLDLPSRVCGDCSQCLVKCSVGFEISRKIRDVIRIREVPQEFIA